MTRGLSRLLPAVALCAAAVGLAAFVSFGVSSADALETTAQEPLRAESASSGQRWRPGKPLRLAFPRLGMWYPDTHNQALAARYDLVMLGSHECDVVPKLRARNPDLIALATANACELSFDPSPDADAEDNAAVRAVPGDWFLTQVGSVLVSGVDSTSTVLHVADVTLSATSGSGKGVDERLFVVGDDVLIDDEVAKVLGVDATTRTLRVQRGYVRPAAPHAAGTRVAALVTFWPRSWMLDLSTHCPRVTVDPALGPETWAEYNARIAARTVTASVWDGIVLDRSDGDESWVIDQSTARSIDPVRSNRRVADGYAAFDAAWNGGIRVYMERVRALVGDERLVFANWGYPNYDLLNGNNFEAFPDERGTAYGSPWVRTVFGPESRGSYFDWLARARQPNLTMIHTEDDGADSTGDASATQRPRPDYRRMRFGLCTSLLGNGFFSYEIEASGQRNLLWFDEYDNAGKGRGYLGQPVGPARRAVGLPSSRLRNRGGGFESQTAFGHWDLWTEEGAGCAAAVALDRTAAVRGRAAARIDVGRASGVGWHVAFGTLTTIRGRRDHTLSFWARADRSRNIEAWVQDDDDPWRARVEFGEVRLTTRWRRYVLCAPATATSFDARLAFGLGQSVGRVWIDDVRLQLGNTQIWRRDFTRGVALVNAGSSARTIALHGTYRHIRGRQVRSVNTGRLTCRVTLRPRDGVILLRAAQARQ